VHLVETEQWLLYSAVTVSAPTQCHCQTLKHVQFATLSQLADAELHTAAITQSPQVVPNRLYIKGLVQLDSSIKVAPPAGSAA
jgi:hypothetical protein